MFESVLSYNNIQPFNKIFMEDNEEIKEEKEYKTHKKQVRQNWTKEEDNALKLALRKFGQNWKKISDALKLENIYRGVNACRERYQNHLNANVSKKNWTVEETKKLFMLQNKYGNKWKNIAAHLPNRSDNIVKNYFYATVRRVLRRLLKSSGNKKCSNLANEIKPCVLGRIFSISSQKSNKINVDQKFTIEFREMILKYQNLKFCDSQKVSKSDKSKIQWIYEQLIKISKNYQNDEQNEYLEYKYHDDTIIDRIVKKLPIFTTNKIPIEKQYKKVQVVQQIPIQYYQDQQYIYSYIPSYYLSQSLYQPSLNFQIQNLSTQNQSTQNHSIQNYSTQEMPQHCYSLLPISSYFQVNPQISQLSLKNQTLATQNIQK